MRTLFLLAVIAALFGCVTNAYGPSFSKIQRSLAPPGASQVYVFRDHAVYAMQSPYVVEAQVEIDRQPIGELKNGGFLTATVAAGRHFITATSGPQQTLRYFDVIEGQNSYIQIVDKTRMAGARALGGLLGGAVAGAAQGADVGNVAAQGETAGQARGTILAGAALGTVGGMAQGASNGFRGKGLYSEATLPGETDGLFWEIEFDSEAQALPTLNDLRLSALEAIYPNARPNITRAIQVAQQSMCSCKTYTGTICTGPCNVDGQTPRGCFCNSRQ